MKLKLLKGIIATLSVIKRKLDEFFLQDQSSIKKKYRIRSVSYYYASAFAIFLVSQLFSQHAPWFLNVISSLLVVLRLTLLKFKLLSFTMALEAFILAFYPLLWSTPNENILKGSVLPLVFSMGMYFYMMPLRLVAFVVAVNVCIIFQLRHSALEIFSSNDNALKLLAVQNLYTGVPFLVVLSFGCMVVCRLQFDAMLKDQKKLNKDLTAANTELMEINKKCRQSLELLEAANKELELSKLQLQEALQAKDLLATVSHELRNPLNSLMGNIELLLDEVTDKCQLQKLQVAKMCADSLLCLINNLLDAAKISSNKLEVSLIPVNMYQFLEKLWRISSTTIKNKNLVGELWISRNFPRYLVIDSHRILQILLNLISNAVKFTERGSVKIMVEWGTKNIFSDTESVFDSTHSGLSINHLQDSSSNSVQRRQMVNLALNEPNTKSIYHTCSSGYLNQRNQLKNPPTRIQTHNENWSFVSEFNDEFSEKINTTTQLQHLHPRFIKDVRSEKLLFFTTNHLNVEEALEKKTTNTNDSHYIHEKTGYLKISIIDTGCGIVKERQSQLFTPFTREDESITRRYSGTGLGLYIIKNLIEKMKGDIVFFSQKNIGTHFMVRIPSETIKYQKNELDPLHRPLSMNFDVSQKNYKGSAVMIVEDSHYNQTILQAFMAKFGLETHICENGKQGYELYKSKPPGYFSFITMDLQMPIMDGITSSILIRKYEQINSILNPVPIVIVSANCSEFETNVCMNPVGQIRASFFFRKPLTFADCTHFVSAVMNSNPRKIPDSSGHEK